MRRAYLRPSGSSMRYVQFSETLIRRTWHAGSRPYAAGAALASRSMAPSSVLTALHRGEHAGDLVAGALHALGGAADVDPPGCADHRDDHQRRLRSDPLGR